VNRMSDYATAVRETISAVILITGIVVILAVGVIASYGL
jgi:nitrate reductase NapE component